MRKDVDVAAKKLELLNLLAHLAPDCRMQIIPLGGKSRLE
jgi:hypothetical protein